MKLSYSKIWGICFIIAFIILFISSPDSYTHDLYQRTDSANFFTSGKSLMKGLIPYSDFTDSKGPLLWTIYGLGYLISHYDYIGIFWLSVIFYSFTFFYVFKIADIFLNNQKRSLFVVILMMSCFFSPWFHYEVRAEDWAQLFIVLTFYRICLFLYTEKGKEPSSLYLSCFILGICLIGTFFIKYNITVMIGIACIYMLYAIIREKKNILLSFLSLIGGIILLALPWIGYTLYLGCFDAFINEYFINTLQTVRSDNNLANYIHEWLFLTYDTHTFLLFTIPCIGAVAISQKVHHYKYFFLITFLGFFAIAIHRCVFLHWYYLSVCLFFPIWLFIYIAKTKTNVKVINSIAVVATSYTIISNCFFWGFLTPTWFFRDSVARADFYKASYYMSQIKQPSVIYYLCGTLGLETPVDGIPATTYWTTQIGATDSMMTSQIKAMLSGVSDFIVAADNEEFPISGTDSLIKQNGYHELMKFRTIETDFVLYSKHQVKNPPKEFHISIYDILLKRNIFKNKKQYVCNTKIIDDLRTCSYEEE